MAVSDRLRKTGLLAALGAFACVTGLLLRPARPAGLPAQSPFHQAQDIERRIADLEGKVLERGEDLTHADFDALRGHLATLEECRESLKQISAVQPEAHDLPAQIAQVSVWVLDVRGLVEGKDSPPAYGGIAIPYARASQRLKALTSIIRGIQNEKDDLLSRGDDEARQTYRERLMKAKQDACECRDELLRLNELIEKDLGDDAHWCREIEPIRDESAMAQMTVKVAGTLMQVFSE